MLYYTVQDAGFEPRTTFSMLNTYAILCKYYGTIWLAKFSLPTKIINKFLVNPNQSTQVGLQLPPEKRILDARKKQQVVAVLWSRSILARLRLRLRLQL